MEGGGPGQERSSCAAEADLIASAVAEAALELSGELRVDAVYAAAAAQLERLLGARVALVHGAEDGGELRLAAARGAPEELLGELASIPVGAPTLAARAAAAQAAQRVHPGEAAAVDLVDAAVIFAGTSCASILAAPLLAGGRPLGVVSCALDAPAGAVELHAALLRALAGVMAMAVGSARDREQAASDLADFLVARDALREAEERFDRTLDDAPIGMALVALDGRFLRVNRALCRILGYAREELLEIRFQEITHPDDLEADLAQAARLVSGEIQAYQLAKRYVCKQGRVIDVMLSGSIVRDAAGRPVHFIAQVQDVTEQKRVEEELLNSERQFHGIFDHALDAILIADNAGRIVDVNPAACAMLRAPRRSLAGQEIFGFVQDSATVRDLWAEFLRAGELKGETSLRLRDGRHLVAEASARAHFLPGRHVAILRDVTARKRAEEEREHLVAELAAERRWLHRVIEESPVGIILVEGPDGRRIAANRRMEELFGRELAPEAGITQYMGQVCAPDGAPVAFEDMPGVRALEGEMTRGRELLLLHPDQRAIPVLASAGPIHDDQGRLLGAAVIYEDVSRLKELERLREEWTSIIAHDLRQPVTIITGYAAVLARKAEEPFRSWARHMLESARRLDRMIGDLHEASRIDARQLTIERQPTDLLALVTTVVQRLAPETQGRPITVDAIGDIPPVDLDPGRIEQVLGNLLSNALKYGDPGTEILVAVARGGDDEVEVSVQNRGPGIAPADLPRLFQRFQRGTSQGQKRADSTGLGLYICRGIIEAHGGRIWAESSPGDTTAFRFTLQASPPPADASVPPPASGLLEPPLDAPLEGAVSSAARG